MNTLILFWHGIKSNELKNMTRRAGFQFDEVIFIESHWMTALEELGYIKTENFSPDAGISYLVITNGAEHNQLVPVIAKLQASGAKYEVYEFFYCELRKLWPLNSN